MMLLRAAVLIYLALAIPTAVAQQKPQPLAPAAGRDPAASAQIKKEHKLIIQVNTTDPVAMNLALNNAQNVEQYYTDKKEKVQIEIIAYGPGLMMFRDDASPVKDRLKAIKEKSPTITFSACENTQGNMSRFEHKEIPIVKEATMVKSGVVRIMELQEQGWSYIRP